MCRSNLRPLFLSSSPATSAVLPPASGKSTPSAGSASNGLNGTAANGKPSIALAPVPATQPQPTALKPLYDAAGTFVSVLLLNYTAAPFMILGAVDSLRAWSRLGWYGHIMLGICLAFFWGGGGRLLKSKSKRVGSSEPNTPGVGTVPPVDLSIREAVKKVL
jgi:lysophospholipid acyltransferase